MASKLHLEDIPEELIFEILEKNPDLIAPLTKADPTIYNFVYGSDQKIFKLLIKNTRKFKRIDSEDEYSEGTVVLTDIKDGIWKTYIKNKYNPEDAELIEFITYKLGKMEGLRETYDSEAKLILKRYYENNKVNGYVKLYGHIKNKKVLLSKVAYVDDVPNGTALSIKYFGHFKSKIEGQLVDGKFVGEWITTNTTYRDKTTTELVTYFYDDGRVTTPRENNNIYTPLYLEGFYDGQPIDNNAVEFIAIGRSLKYNTRNRSQIIETIT